MFSMVLGSTQDPVAKMVFMTAANSDDKKGDNPTWENMIVE